MAVSVSAERLALYVDCSLLESVDWVSHGMGISTDGLLMVGGITEGFETPFEVSGLTPTIPSLIIINPTTYQLLRYSAHFFLNIYKMPSPPDLS